jgi:hypothetical protein
VSSTAAPSHTTASPARSLPGSEQAAVTVPTAPESKDSSAAVASSTSRPSAVDGAAVARTSTTSPASSRARSSTWVSCSTTWPAGALPPRPPRRRRHLVQPGRVDQPGPVRGADGAARGHGVQVPPVVAGRGRQPGSGHGPRHLLGDLDAGGQRLLDENGTPARTAASSSSPWAKGGTHSQTPSRAGRAAGRRPRRPARPAHRRARRPHRGRRRRCPPARRRGSRRASARGARRHPRLRRVRRGRGHRWSSHPCRGSAPAADGATAGHRRVAPRRPPRPSGVTRGATGAGHRRGVLSSSAPSPSAARLGGPTPPAEHDTPTIWQTTVAGRRR